MSVTRPLAIVTSLTAALLLAGCGANAGDSGSGRQAVAAFYPLAWVTGRVAGDGWQVANLTAPGKEPHDLSLDIQATADLAQSDLVVLERGFQPGVDDAVETNAADVPLVDAAEVVDLLPAAKHDEHSDEGEEGGADEGEDHEGHDHGDLDPHFWQDPLLLADVADAVAAQLGETDPDGAAGYDERADALREELESLDADYTAGLGSCERTVTVVSHEAFSYLSRYGLTFEAIAGLSPGAEPTPADLARLEELARDEGVTTVFSERLASAKMSETLASDLGIETAVLDPLEGLSDETTDEDYLSLMRENLAALQEANGCR